MVAGAFRFRVDQDFAGRSLLEWGTNFRSRWLRLPYGDQVIFLRRSLFEELGGFAEISIMEDYELVLRLRRLGRIAAVPLSATTSGRRWRRLGIFKTTLINALMVAGYHAGISNLRLAKCYRALLNKSRAA
jgi:GT2 family glycosyltransferase